MQESNNLNKTIAKNTILLYFRTVVTMLVALYTSRVILNTLGVEDYGIYNAVGGFVAMFGVISGALSNAVSRHLTYAIGKETQNRINTVFCTCVNIQVVLTIIILIISEIFGVWYLNNKLNLPSDRLVAANWVFQCSLVTFVVNLVSIPYNACIIAYEKMGAYAYISILEASLKLFIVYLLILSSIDKLVLYSVLLVIVSVIIRLVYGVYCKIHFVETKYRFYIDKPLFNEMLKFAGWNFFSNLAYILNTQGVTLLVNSYFGVLLNSARGIAIQVDNSVSQFVNNFTMAVNPQIIKSYAKQDYDRLYNLVCKGTKFAFFLFLIFTVPIILEADYILELWLNIVPEHTCNFVRLALIGALVATLGNCGYTACMATGNIKMYSIVITSISCLVFFITWLVYFLGAPVEFTYIVYIIVYIIVQIVRLFLMKSLINFPPLRFVREVIAKILMPTLISFAIPSIVVCTIQSTFFRLLLTIVTSVIISVLSIYFTGLSSNERKSVKKYLISKI